MSQVKVKVENAKIVNYKLLNCKNGKKLMKFAICIGQDKELKPKWVNCLYFAEKEWIVSSKPISFEGWLDVEKYIYNGVLRTSVNLMISKIYQPTMIVDNNQTIQYEAKDDNSEFFNELNKENKEEESLEWFEDEKETDTGLANEQEEPIL